MSTRRAFDETEAARAHRPAAETEGLGLWAQGEPTVPRWAETWSSLTDDERRAQRERWKELLLPIVRELAARPQGVTWSEVTTAGIERAILFGERMFLSKYPRIYSWGGAWLAQLAKAGEVAPKVAHVEGHGTIRLERESDRGLSHSNDGLIYIRVAA